MQQTQRMITVLAYVGHNERMELKQEIALCRKAAKAIDGTRRLTAIYGPSEFERFISELRPTNIAVLPRLYTLSERPIPKGKRLGATFSRRVLELVSTCLYVVDAAAEVRSIDEGWPDHVERVHSQITHGRTMSSEEGKRRAKGRKRRAPGLEAHWKMIEGTPAYIRVRQHWLDPTLTAAEAIATAPKIAGDLNTAHRSTWERIFGLKTTGAPRSKSNT